MKEKVPKNKKTKAILKNSREQSDNHEKNKRSKSGEIGPKKKKGTKKVHAEKCSICHEYGEDEIWYTCGNCAIRAHAQRTDAENAKQFICDRSL